MSVRARVSLIIFAGDSDAVFFTSTTCGVTIIAGFTSAITFALAGCIAYDITFALAGCIAYDITFALAGCIACDITFARDVVLFARDVVLFARVIVLFARVIVLFARVVVFAIINSIVLENPRSLAVQNALDIPIALFLRDCRENAVKDPGPCDTAQKNDICNNERDVARREGKLNNFRGVGHRDDDHTRRSLQHKKEHVAPFYTAPGAAFLSRATR